MNDSEQDRESLEESLISSISHTHSSFSYSLNYDEQEGAGELLRPGDPGKTDELSKRSSVLRRLQRCCSSYLPIFEWSKRYRPLSMLHKDFLAGLTVGIIAVPQALSYATVAGLTPVHGLYAAFVGIIPYLFLGTSPHLVTGPTAVMSIIVKSAVPRTYHGNKVVETSDEWTQLAYALALLTGCVQIVLSLAGLGFIVELVSHPIIAGFTSAAAVLIIGTQLPSTLGVPTCDPAELMGAAHKGEECYLHEVIYSLATHAHEANVPTIVASILSIAFLFGFKTAMRKISPTLATLGPLLLVSLCIGVMRYLTAEFGESVVHGDMRTRYYDGKFHIRFVGPIESGLPGPCNPVAVIQSFRDVVHLTSQCVPIVLIGFMEAITISTTVARKAGVDSPRPANELVALGTCNILCSGFQGYAVTGSFSRTSVNADSGAMSPLASAFGAVIVGLTLLFLTDIVEYTPKFALASVVITSVVGLVDLNEARKLWVFRRQDFYVFTSVFVVTLFFGVAVGLVVGISLSWIIALRDSQPVQIAAISCILNELDASYAEQSVLCVATPYSSITFANVHKTKSSVKAAQEIFDPEWIVIDCLRVSSIDSSGMEFMKELAKSEETPSGESKSAFSVSTKFCFVNMHAQHLEQLYQYDRFETKRGRTTSWCFADGESEITGEQRVTIYVGSLKEAIRKLKESIAETNHQQANTVHWVPLCPQYHSVEAYRETQFVSFENLHLS